MREAETLSGFGKNYCLKHIYLVRDFCFACNEAIAKGDLNSAKFYKGRAHRIVKGINPFSNYLDDADRNFLHRTKKRLERAFDRIEAHFEKNDGDVINNVMEEIIVDTLDLEKKVLGTSFVKLSHDLLIRKH
ncbi:MAG: hypothetical protein OEZ20_06300 [candidate division WOR-3 bacterium]|nr:hypothetical protein [candidate division WOR-3 bacterium]MDH5684055.1 hypothetical protein [candidate division WOR-3 bacterium]